MYIEKRHATKTENEDNTQRYKLPTPPQSSK